MMLLRAHCEMKQGRHVHDTAENRSEFLNQYLGGGTLFTKAKRSLTSSFDHLLKRKASRDDFGPMPTRSELNLSVNNNNRESSPICSGDTEETNRSRTSTSGSQSEELNNIHLLVEENPRRGSVSPEKNLKSPMMDM